MGHGAWGARRRSPPPSPPLTQSHTPVVGSHGSRWPESRVETRRSRFPETSPTTVEQARASPPPPHALPPPPPRRPAPARRRGGEGWWVAGALARARSIMVGRALRLATAHAGLSPSLSTAVKSRAGAQARRRASLCLATAPPRARHHPSPPRRLACSVTRAPRPPRHSCHVPCSMRHAACTNTHIDAGKPKNRRAGAPWTFEGSNLSGSPREPPPRGSSLPHTSRGAPRG
jgi:hypothetical protein